MAGQYDEGVRVHGPPHFTLVPCSDHVENNGLPLLHSSRATNQDVNFFAVGESEEWYPGTSIISGPGVSCHALGKQKRWLDRNHPEASIGTSEIISDFLSETEDASESDAANPSASSAALCPLLVIGQMTDISDSRRPRPKSVLAMAAGESGELLRLTSLREAEWQWGLQNNPVMYLSYVDQDDAEASTYWSMDDSPISQVKVALNLERNDPSRYIIVQKKLSTVVLKPQYRKTPVPASALPGTSATPQPPSRIDPKPILVVRNQDTGGNPHTDVSFSPGGEGRPDYLAIVDERGYWTVWDMHGKVQIGINTLLPGLRCCGHIQNGILDDLPSDSAPFMSPRIYGILWTGSTRSEKMLGGAAAHGPEDLSIPSSLSQPLSASNTLAIWSGNRFEMVNIEELSRVPHGLQLLKTQHDRIVDVQLNPANQSQIFVLTRLNLFWLEVGSSHGLSSGSGRQAVTVLLHFPHLKRLDEGETMGMRLHRGWPGQREDACSLCLHSDCNSHVDIFMFSLDEQTGLPQFQHHSIQVQGVRPANKRDKQDIQTLYLAPAPLFGTAESAMDGPGSEYSRRGDHFWQLFTLHKNLSLTCSVVVATSSNANDINLPDTCPDVASQLQERRHAKRRATVIRRLDWTFAAPDEFGDMDSLARMKPPPELAQGAERHSGKHQPRRWPKTLGKGADRLLSHVAVSIQSVAAESRHIAGTGDVPGLDAAQNEAQRLLADEDGHLALRTLRECANPFEAPPIMDRGEEAWNSRLQEILSLNDERINTEAILSSFLGTPIGSGMVTLQDILGLLKGRWQMEPGPLETQELRHYALVENADAILRSLFGVMILDKASATPPEVIPMESIESKGEARTPVAAELSQPTAYLTPRTTQSLSPGPAQSQASSSRMSRSPSREPDAMAAMQRLSRLASHIDLSKKPAGPPHPVLSHWPDEPGSSTQDYQSSLKLKISRQREEVRSRSQRAESRHRSRRQRTVEGFSRGSTLEPGAWQPAITSSQALPVLPDRGRAAAPDIPGTASQQPLAMGMPPIVSSSQAQSSQPGQMLGQTMSQPTAGYHGRRPPPAKKKKGKRRGGF